MTLNPEEMARKAIDDRPLRTPDVDRLSKLARDIVQGVVFSSDSIKDNPAMDGRLVASIFMPLALGATKDMTHAELDDIGMFYAPMDSAFGRAINGCPTFGSVGWLNKRDAAIVRDKIPAVFGQL